MNVLTLTPNPTESPEPLQDPGLCFSNQRRCSPSGSRYPLLSSQSMEGLHLELAVVTPCWCPQDLLNNNQFSFSFRHLASAFVQSDSMKGFIDPYIDGSDCQEQFGVQYLAQGHFDMHLGGAGI